MNSAGARRSMKSTESGLASSASTSALPSRLALNFHGCVQELLHALDGRRIGRAAGNMDRRHDRGLGVLGETRTKAARRAARREEVDGRSCRELSLEGSGASRGAANGAHTALLLQQACQRAFARHRRRDALDVQQRALHSAQRLAPTAARPTASRTSSSMRASTREADARQPIARRRAGSDHATHLFIHLRWHSRCIESPRLFSIPTTSRSSSEPFVPSPTTTRTRQVPASPSPRSPARSSRSR